MVPIYIVIHQLKKEQHKNRQKSDTSKVTLDITNPKVLSFFNDLVSAYGKKANTAQYGTFQNIDDTNSIGYKLNQTSSLNTETDFLKISQDAMQKLELEADKTTSSSGGFIVFSKYQEGKSDFFMIAMVKKKNATTINNKLDIEDLEYIDLSKLHQAFRLNLASLAKFRLASSDEKSLMTYLSFISASTQQTTAGYFVQALGCKKGSHSAKSTKNTLIASKRFFSSHSELSQSINDFKPKLESYLNLCQKTSTNATLQKVESIARTSFPTNLKDKHDQLAEEFVEFLNNEEYQVPSEFSVDKNTIKKYLYVSYSDNEIELLLKKDMISRDQNGAIFVKDGQLIFRKPSKELLAKIEDTLVEQEKEKEQLLAAQEANLEAKE